MVFEKTIKVGLSNINAAIQTSASEISATVVFVGDEEIKKLVNTSLPILVNKGKSAGLNSVAVVKECDVPGDPRAIRLLLNVG